MSEKKIVDTFSEGDTLSIEFLAHVIDSALSCEPTASDLPVRLNLAASARACLDFYVTKLATVEYCVPSEVLENLSKREAGANVKPDWVDKVLATYGKNGTGQ